MAGKDLNRSDWWWRWWWVQLAVMTPPATSCLPPRCKGGGRGRGWVTTVATGPSRGGWWCPVTHTDSQQSSQAIVCGHPWPGPCLVNSKCRITDITEKPVRTLERNT